MRHRKLAVIATLAIGYSAQIWASSDIDSPAYGISSRMPAKPYLNMPHRADGRMPSLLSQTGAFTNTRHL